ncbi:hypothetical protein V3C99_017262, partial [Haemonchus contortus]
MHVSSIFVFTLVFNVYCIQVRIRDQYSNDKSTSSRPAVVIRTGTVTVNNPKLPSTISARTIPAEKQPNLLRVLIIGSKQDVLTTTILRKIASILGDAAHRVTLFSPFTASATSAPSGQYTSKNIDYAVKSEAIVNAWDQFSALERIRTIRRASHDMITFCEKVFGRMDVIDWMRNEKFDIAITNGATCFQPLLRMAGIRKSIILTASEPAPWIVKAMGIPYTESPTVNALPYFRRAKTVLSSYTEEMLLEYDLIHPLNHMGQRMVGERFTPFQDAVAQTSFLLVNGDELLDFPRPLTLQWVYIGGLHVKQPLKLSQQWSTLLSMRARNVLVVFGGASPGCSQGTTVLLQAFLEIPDTTFIWRNASGPGLNQSNVVFVSQVSESDLLADPRVTAIITDGRTDSLYDIATGGKPVICIPSNFEQQGNCDRLHERGIAIVKGCDSLSSKNVKEMIKQCTTSEIRDLSKAFSEALKSKLVSRNEKLIRTVEYAAKYGVAPRPHSSVSNGSLSNIYHLDIFIPLLLISIALTVSMVWLICTLVDMFLKRRPHEADDGVKQRKLSDPAESQEPQRPIVTPVNPAETLEQPPSEGI